MFTLTRSKPAQFSSQSFSGVQISEESRITEAPNPKTLKSRKAEKP